MIIFETWPLLFVTGRPASPDWQFKYVHYLPTSNFHISSNWFIFCVAFPGQENCPYDYIKIYDGKNELSPVIGTFCGMGKFPYSIIGTSQDLFVEFVSSPAGKKCVFSSCYFFLLPVYRRVTPSFPQQTRNNRPRTELFSCWRGDHDVTTSGVRENLWTSG